MRLFFHLVDQHEAIRDQEGVEVTDLAHAQTEALTAIDELRRQDETAARCWSGWTLQVTDASGAVVLSVDLDGITRSS